MYGRLPIAKMIAATVAMTAAISAVMLSINWDGQEASTAAPKIDDLLNVMIVISSLVFSLVVVMLFYALYKFKAKPGDESDGEPVAADEVHGILPRRQTAACGDGLSRTERYRPRRSSDHT